MFWPIQKWATKVYKSQSGRCPFKEWLDAVADQRALKNIGIRLERLRAGHFGDFGSLGKGVFELRIDIGPGYRIYFAQLSSETMIILYGGEKSSQKKDIQRAQTYWAETKAV